MKIAERILETLNNLGSLQNKTQDVVKPKVENQAMFQPPKGAVQAAKKAIEWKEKHGDEVKGGTQVGWTRAGQLARGEKVSLDIVKRMHSFFSRHAGNEEVKPELKSTPWKDNGLVAFLIWGGAAGRSWAKSIATSNKNEELDEYLDKISVQEYRGYKFSIYRNVVHNNYVIGSKLEMPRKKFKTSNAAVKFAQSWINKKNGGNGEFKSSFYESEIK